MNEQAARTTRVYRVTRGRHCSCTACKQEDWTRITAPCGMHGSECPAVYAPIRMFCKLCGKPWRFDNAAARAYSCPCGGTEAVGTVTFVG